MLVAPCKTVDGTQKPRFYTEGQRAFIPICPDFRGVVDTALPTGMIAAKMGLSPLRRQYFLSATKGVILSVAKDLVPTDGRDPSLRSE
jgi:hypothetical protein